MAILQLIGNLFKVFFFFASLWTEKNKEKAQKKEEIGKRIVNAFKQTDKSKRASRLNSVVNDIRRLR
jgi:hypothetical protein